MSGEAGKFLQRVRRKLARTIAGEPDAVAWSRPMYAQQGEDALLDCLFGQRATGFYVDVGAHHPWRYSNTYFFYQSGWRGLNIDATPGSMAPFVKHRSRDINVECAVATTAGQMTFYEFDEPTVNTLSDESAQRCIEAGRFKLTRKVAVQAYPLAELLDKHLPAGESIDFMSIDVEGIDEDVLRSNDWTRFRPTLVVTEDTSANSLTEAASTPSAVFLAEQNYFPIGKLVHSIVHVDRQQFKLAADRSVLLGKR